MNARAVVKLGSLEDRQADCFDATRAYLDACDDADNGSTMATRLAARHRVHAALHDMELAVRGECSWCAPGTCKGYITRGDTP